MADAQVNLGDTVDIVAGPFSGGHAVVKASANGLLQVEMPVLGQPVPFTVKLDQVRVRALGHAPHA